jgi:predicted negative regulator of RcsB-dependent stress response
MEETQSYDTLQENTETQESQTLFSWVSNNSGIIILILLILFIIYSAFQSFDKNQSGFLGQTIRDDPSHDSERNETIENYIEELKQQQQINIQT